MTTKILAHEVCISEALLYQHFSSKDELFRELVDILEARAPAIQQYFLEAQPTSRLLVDYLSMMTYVSLHPSFQKEDARLSRLLLESLLGDGNLAQTHMNRRWGSIKDILVQAYRAAQNSGDIVALNEEPHEDLRLFFSHQLVMMIHCFWHVPKQSVMPETLSPEDLIDQVMLFILQGIGFKQSAIKRLYGPEKILGRLAKIVRELS